VGFDWKTLIGVLGQTLCRIAGQLVLSYGMRQMPARGGEENWLLHFLGYVTTTPIILLGVALLAADFAIHLGLLSRVDVSIVVPSGSLTYLVTALLATWFLNENPPPQRWAGIALITVGVALVLSSRYREEEEKEAPAPAKPLRASAALLLLLLPLGPGLLEGARWA
jgi:drug/metabolite transporter (DMT)-like permease